MGVKGLSTYLQQDPSNFSSFELHNTRLVIDALNFINFLQRKSGLTIVYGGEYMDFNICVRDFLKKFRMCRISPIFLFDGCNSEEGIQLGNLLKKNKQRIQSINQVGTLETSDVEHYRPNPDIRPALTYEIVIQILIEYNVPYLTCDGKAGKFAAELAMFLDCPVLSNDCDFYLFRSVDSETNLQFILLDTLDAKPKCLESLCDHCKGQTQEKCFSMTGQLFSASKCSFSAFNPPLLPLIAFIIGSDMTAPITFVSPTGNHCGPEDIPSVFKWLSNFGSDTFCCVRELLQLYRNEALETVVDEIIGCLKTYLVNPDASGYELCNLMKIVRSRFPVSDKHVPRVPQNSTTMSQCDEMDSIDNAAKKICQVLSGEVVKTQSRNELFNGWSSILLEQFRRGNISTYLLDAIYVRGGTMLRVLFEQIEQQKSIYNVSLSVRAVFYSMLIQMELQLGNANKLCGLNDGRPVENRREGMEIGTFNINLPEVKINVISGENNLLNFLRDSLNLKIARVQKYPRHIVPILIVLSLCLRNTSHQHFKWARYNSMVLAFLSCFLVTCEHVNGFLDRTDRLESILDNLCKCYTKMVDIAKFSSSRIPSCSHFSISVVHQLNELQIMYTELASLVRLYEALSSSSSEVLMFLPVWLVFPSGRFLHWMAQSIESCPPSKRFKSIRSYWLPRMLGEDSNLQVHQRILNQLNLIINDVTAISLAQ